MHIVIIDCEGEPIQEFSALYVNVDTEEIVSVFHEYVQCGVDTYDVDFWARKHIHGLNRDFISMNGLQNQAALFFAFQRWLNSHPFERIFANGPCKEQNFLSMKIEDVKLPQWKDRASLMSHKLALSLKKNVIPICDVTCCAHSSFVGWSPKRPHSLTLTDIAKRNFSIIVVCMIVLKSSFTFFEVNKDMYICH